jgi:hypothetical protein
VESAALWKTLRVYTQGLDNAARCPHLPQPYYYFFSFLITDFTKEASLCAIRSGFVKLLTFLPTCGSQKLVATINRQVGARVIMPLAAHSGDATHPLLGLP